MADGVRWMRHGCTVVLTSLLYVCAVAEAAGPVVHAAVVAGDRLIVGGEFTLGAGRSNLASIDLRSGAIETTWIADTDGPVYALELSASGTLVYVGGDFEAVRGTPRANIAAINAGSGNLTEWNPGADGAVRAFAGSAVGRILYAGGDFTVIGGAPRARLASLDTQVNTGSALPWRPDPDGTVHALTLDESGGRLYAGGVFTAIGAQARNGLAALTLTSAAALPWNPAPAAGARVLALRLGDGVLYAGGDFQLDGTEALIAVDTVSGVALDWNPALNGEVRSLAWDAAGARLYAGGTFTQAGGAARSRIAAFRTDASVPEFMAWNPGGDAAIASVEAMLVDAARQLLHVGGELSRIDSVDLDRPLASLDIALPVTELDRESGAYREPGMVELACVPGASACLQICYRDETVPTPPLPPMNCAAGPLTVPVARTTLRFFSEDVDGNREPLRTANYAVDTRPPSVDISLPAGLYGERDDTRVELACVDDQPEFGCAIHYTLDNTPADAGSPAYVGPIVLASLFPDPSIPAEEVDPLRHLAGTVTLRAIAIDGAGNAEPAQSRSYTIDLAAPIVSASVPSGNYVAPLTVTLSCDDGLGSGCAALYYRLDGAEPELDDAGEPVPPARTYSEPLVLETATSLSILALDHASNRRSGLIAVYALTAAEAQSESGVGASGPAFLALLFTGLLGVRLRGKTGSRPGSVGRQRL